MSTAILIDGAFFIKRFRQIEPHNRLDHQRAADLAFRWALAHLSSSANPRHRNELYRIFFYDCPPLEKKLHNPISGRAIDYSKSDEAIFRHQLHEQLRNKRKVALRLGHLAGNINWTIKPDSIQRLLKQQMSWDEITHEHVTPSFSQKGVDMRIGIDITSLALKKQVDQIVLIAGDADFVPAAKLARREGIDFILDPMWQRIPSGLNEHIDGLRSTCPNPITLKAASVTAAPNIPTTE
ncbi:NYN domain-containing protein [Chitinibacter sp. FCG-7]|uniref:NYN domain-containing protein n=1 Tax=Chitinibacter mangrovi TaxID=3153927 RepID=A0AAU7F7T9_9NEIS